MLIEKKLSKSNLTENKKLIKRKGGLNFDKQQKKNNVIEADFSQLSRANLIFDKLVERLNPEKKKKAKKLQERISNGIDDPEEAREVIEEMRKILPPIISVPKKYLNDIKKKEQISAKPTWTGHKIIAGVIGRKPYVHQNDDRVFFAVKSHVPLQPRFTGQPKNNKYVFRGVVMLPDNYNSLNLNKDLVQL